MPKSHVSQAKDVSSSRESEPPNRPHKLFPLIGLRNLPLYSYFLDIEGKEKDLYEEVPKALRKGRDYEEWAWWPYLIFPIPEESYPPDESDPFEKGEFISRKYSLHIITILQNKMWGTRLGYAVKLLDKLDGGDIRKIIEGTPGNGREFQKRRMVHFCRFLLSYNYVLAIPDYEDNREAREICLRLLTRLWLDDRALVERLKSEEWGDEKPVDFEEKQVWLSKGTQGGPSFFSQGMKLAADGKPLDSPTGTWRRGVTTTLREHPISPPDLRSVEDTKIRQRRVEFLRVDKKGVCPSF
ncbi:uncharacterized protein B0T23DRAFT_412117 [Neurospora hispaniola]|uniref:Opioid growth factor receptor (OGFr) conserved domain-containing protein n=1 Tax=Neurospora hispaniola TaxID=588809 RepID=A0AAJ0MSZ2_9PEZI|nr:hypothetical protein B0T23DRAFT_412117 [Neurospora hispaniola]